LNEETFVIVVSPAYVKWPRIWLENVRGWWVSILKNAVTTYWKVIP